ncbi:phosphatidylserine decarboxylase [Cumulibacter manganitolerans]|uniref:phosphatidylserine decarboxylase n=1 Tax=Cumulibacter manganitolerans TaxID=1884992 RepID=UPI0012965361|nr:phosphatidylserine decarboxylase [Cumulibacter manganitolerans]
MKIDKDAAPFTALAAAPTVVAALAGKRRLALGLAALTAGVTAFFRDPQRFPDLGHEVDASIVLAPADGRVMHAGPGQAGIAPEGDWNQVSIFLSLLDVHINRTPYGGTVTKVAHRPGRFLAAFKNESATENECTELVVERDVDGEHRVVVFRQIVGLLARRVVTRVAPGDRIATGQRIGLMKFGSRMDVFVPASVPLLVSEGDRVIAGESTLARWPQSGSVAR